MKIAIFSDNFYPELSGISDSIILQGRALEEMGHSILFVGPRYSNKDYKKAGLPKEMLFIADSDIRVKRLASLPMPFSPTGQSRMVIPYLGSLYLMMRFKPDVIYTNSPFGTGIDALIAAKILRIPLVGTNHTPIGEFMAYSPLRAKWFTNLANKFFVWYYNRCCIVSAPCQSLLDEMKTFGFKAPSVKIPNGVELARFEPPKEGEKEKLKKQFGFGPHTILYTGRLAPEKNIDQIIKAAAIVKNTFPDLTLVITGHGSAENALKKLVLDLKLVPNVKFTGFVTDPTLPLIYQGSDLFVIMSQAESQSLSLMQAMASGLPVIGANSRALPEYIDSESGTLVPQGDISALADNMLKILGDAHLAQKLGQGGIISVRKYAPEKIAAEWENIYNKAAKKDPALYAKAKN